MNNVRVASIYVKALYSLAEERDELNNVGLNLEFIYRVLLSHDDLKKAMLNPLIPADIKKTILEEILAKSKKVSSSSIFQDFLNLLSIKNRFEVLKEIWEIFEDKLLAKENKQKATVFSAKKLNENQLSSLAEELGKKHCCRFILNNVTEPDLLGGCRIKIKDKIYDYSIKSQLDALSKQMLKA